MAIHIPSSKMTSLPSYNLIVNNKIASNIKTVKLENNDIVNVETALSYSYNNITSVYGDCLYEFKIQKDKLYDTTATDVGADELTYNSDNSAIIIRKRISLTDSVVSLNWQSLASGSSSISRIYVYTNTESIWYQIPELNVEDRIRFSNVNLSTYQPSTWTEIGVAIDVTTLKYNFVDIIVYIPLSKLASSTETEFFYKFMNNTEGYGSYETLNYVFNVENINVEGSVSAFESSELIQTQTVVNQTPIYKYLTDNIIEHFKNGRQTMSVSCIYSKYYSYDESKNNKDSEQVVLNGTDGKIIEVGDIVVPTKYVINDDTFVAYEEPIAINYDGSHKEFLVTSSEVGYNNGELVINLEMVEVT